MATVAMRATTTRSSSTCGSRSKRVILVAASHRAPSSGDPTMNRIGAGILGLVLSVIAGTAGAQTSGDVTPAARKAGEEKAVNLCSTCHGPRGVSTSPEFPILAAQRPGYLVNQINAFRSQARAEKDAHDFMWGIAGNLDEAIIGGIAAYYAGQPPAPGRTDDPKLV